MNVKLLELKEQNALRIFLNATDSEKEFLLEKLENYGSDNVFVDLLEDYQVNGWGLVKASTIYQLSDCFVISREAWMNEDFSYSMVGKSWSNFHNYQINCPVKDMIENGYTDFFLWQDSKDNVITFNTFYQRVIKHENSESE